MFSCFRLQVLKAAICVDHISGDDGEERHGSPNQYGGNSSNSHEEVVCPVAKAEELAPRSSLGALLLLFFVGFLSDLVLHHCSIQLFLKTAPVFENVKAQNILTTKLNYDISH